MALELTPRPSNEYAHSCPLPWPVDPESPEGHVCECGRRWVYQPAHWDPLLTLDELRRRHEAGAFLRGIIPTFRDRAEPPGMEDEPGESAVIVQLTPATRTIDELPG
jgi:hypothetical protein